MMKEQEDKLLKQGENKAMFRAYCPIIDQVVEAETKEEWEVKVQEIIKEQNK